MNPCSRLFLYCRTGFEKETLAETLLKAGESQINCSGSAPERSAYVLLQPDDPEQASELAQLLRVQDLIFARHLLACDSNNDPLPTRDRVTPLLQRLAAMQRSVGTFSGLWLGYPDSEAGKVLAPLCRALHGRIHESLQKNGWLSNDPHQPRAEILFLSGSEALSGLSWPSNGAQWPMGIPRLRLPDAAPSRAALKLEEAFWQLLNANERQQRLTPGQWAVDLGAAPGGWSQILLHMGLSVIAVDRADLSPTLHNTARLRHLREDGFHFRPEQPVDWLFCDMVEQPRRIAELISRWAQAGWCRAALFNLKLPMKKRFEELLHCRQLLLAPLQRAGISCQLRLRHLYHDREEVTGLLLLNAKQRSMHNSRSHARPAAPGRARSNRNLRQH
ncbi:23S rRNA (cytidine(2498)-2'-O)-methyltransferase RlmM [Candidatus Magnetaquicoccus inordinatus]|uniref:23S rRNA (cytidine(2498)-2'-O)-methyltransferase RlmM n=1 Tax=Candidatus Magnetaquicoccus inordinatus TaxID=2496818 RepID=UPI00102BD091|nr:23S rRNA (cytidine(2498)-2'-O)-methyltransferase RlmM [Candidatus Magnetaquicoccus inordinatus]